MDQEREGKSERRDDMEIRFPFGGSVRASGRIVIWVVLALGLAGLGIWHDVKSTAQNSAVIDELRNVAYVLTLSDTEKKRLNLSVPESLRARMAKDRAGPRIHEER